MEAEQGKLFVANLKNEVTANHLNTYFSTYGKVTDALVVRHKGTVTSKGFGFVTFNDPVVAATVLEGNHMILDQKVDVKKAKPKIQQKVPDVNDGNTENCNNRNSSDDDGKNNNSDGEKNDNGDSERFSRKIFVGGLPPNITKEELGGFLESFGAITDVFVILNRETKKPRGFGFVTFETEETAAKVLKNKFYKLNDRNVEVKKAESKIKKHDNTTHVYNSYGNLEFSNNGSGLPYNYCDFYWPIWCPYYQPCLFCASRGVFDPSCYFCASQYSIYNAHFSLNNLEFNGEEEHWNDCETGESSIGNLSKRLMAQNMKKDHQEEQANSIDA